MRTNIDTEEIRNTGSAAAAAPSISEQAGSLFAVLRAIFPSVAPRRLVVSPRPRTLRLSLPAPRLVRPDAGGIS
ncbi:hypothetical protein DEA06_04965 [Microbacterium sp. Gd 4-13]|nr:hypothetical protein DEA06_04965 [Microbacterium sp. Gd 4-13]